MPNTSKQLRRNEVGLQGVYDAINHDISSHLVGSLNEHTSRVCFLQIFIHFNHYLPLRHLEH